LLLRFLLCVSLCYKFSPFQALGKVTLHPHCQACVFIYSSCGRWVFPPLLWSFLPPLLSQAFLLLVVGCTPPLPPEPLQPTWLVYFTVPGRLPFPQSSALKAPHPLSHVSLLLIAFYSVSLFSPGGGQSIQGAMLLWPTFVCGSTAVPQSSPGPHLPKPSGHWRLATQGPSSFLCLT
jgi:hypothetical protein